MLGKQPYVVVTGPVGAGKSTLVHALARQLNADALLERFDTSPYFAQFFDSPAEWAFKHFVFFLEQSFSDQLSVRGDSFSIQERTTAEHLEVFGSVFRSRGFLTKDDFELLKRLTSSCMSASPNPSLLISIEVSKEESWRRLAERATDAERKIEPGYLDELHDQQRRFLSAWTSSPVLTLSSETHDFRDSSTVSLIADQVMAMHA